MRYTLSVLATLLLVNPVHAGNNSAGKAGLSWDHDGVVFQLTEPPSSSFPLFLHLADAPDIRSLAVELRWSTGDSAGCYTVVSSAAGAGCGWATDTSPGGGFEGDNTYTWSISFDPASAKSCVVYTVSSAACAPSTPVKFWLASVLAKDANGAVDSLETLEQATVGSGTPSGSSPELVPGTVLLEFDRTTLSSDADLLGLRDIKIKSIRDYLKDNGFAEARKAYRGSRAADTLATARDGLNVRIPDVSRWYVVRVRTDADAAQLADALKALPGIVHARPSRVVHLFAFPNDPELGQQWQLGFGAGIRAPAAWDYNTGRSDVIMAVLDTGVDDGHGDLDPGDRSHVILGRDTADEDDNTNDDATAINGGGHGTKVAGTLGAITNNGTEVAGVMWNCKILPVKVFQTNPPWWCIPPFDCSGSQTSDINIGEGIYWAATHGANIINMSFGGTNTLSWGKLLGDADPIAMNTYTAFRLGCTLLGGTGKTGDATVNFPAGYPWVVAVAGTDGDSAWASDFSNYGPHVDVAAPGRNNWTTSRDLGTDYFSGTSAATPVASGVAGLILSEGRDWNLNLTNEDVAAVLENSATDIHRTGEGWDPYTGWGLVNAQQALALLNPPYTLARGTAVGGNVALTWAAHDHEFIRGDGDLPSGRYFGVEQYRVLHHVSFCGPYASAPYGWVQSRQTIGWSSSNPNFEVPWGDVVNSTTSGCDVRTYVYHIPYDLAGRHVDLWYPCRPEQAAQQWAVLGNIPLQSVEVTGSHYECVVNLGATYCGGAADRTYAWYERPAGGTWSDVVGTGPTYTRVLPSQTDMEFRLNMLSGGVALADTHFVTYRNCVVAVGDEKPRELRLAVSPNPSGGHSVFNVEIPSPQQISISVYDVTGRLLKRIVDQSLPAGVHRFEWDLREASGTKVGSGLYFVRLSAASGERKARLAVVQ